MKCYTVAIKPDIDIAWAPGKRIILRKFPRYCGNFDLEFNLEAIVSRDSQIVDRKK